MRRREAILARKEGRPPRRFGEADYLLGVYDLNRMGALRFRERGSDVFQSSDRAMAAPPWSTLRDLEYASFLVERDEEDEELDQWLAMLIAPGSSLGGARPKASVADEKGDLWIAKFPSTRSAVATWRERARRLGITNSEIDRMAGAFEKRY